MSDYSSVGPPQAQNFSTSAAFAAALQRAKQIAAKIHPDGQGTKRPMQSDSSEPEAKKFNSDFMNSSSNPNNMQQAVQQAAAVAARLAQSAGGNTVNEEIRLPEQIANLLNGRSGNDDVLADIQGETNVKITVSRESDRAFTLSGARENIAHAKDSLNSLCAQHNASGVETISAVVVPPSGNSGYPPYQEIMVPGAKVGLVIGKGGETIKMLQEKTGAKMVIIQDGPGQELVEKPLRISGDPQKVEHAKQLVFDLILDKEANNSNNRYNFNGGGGGVPSGGDQAEVFVPKTAVGVVIGKGGEMIKKIQGDTGCKLQFIQGKGDGPGDRRCIISGTKQQVEDAKRTIEDLIDSVMRSNQNNQNRNNQNQGLTNSNYGYGTDNSQQSMREEVSFSVPASKCGIVIGRGGETIKLINQQSGAFCEMDRGALNPPSEKMFKMKGTSEQIEHARQLISEKIGIDISILSTRPIGAGGPGGAGQGGPQGGYAGMQANNGANPYGQAQQQQWAYQQQMWDPSQQQSAGAAGQPDYSAQWIEYYKSIGYHREAEMIEQQLKLKQATGQQVAMPAANGNPQAPMAVVPTQQQQQQQVQQIVGGGQADYSKQWAEYYRSVGKNDEAEAIEKQIQAMKTSGQSPSNGGHSGASVSAGNYSSAQPGVGANYSNQQYQQFYGNAGQNSYGAPQGYGGYGYPNAPGQPQQGNDKN